MPINLQGSGNIAEGWGKPPELSAPNIGALVHAILANRLARDKMTQESIGDTIKNVQEQRQSGAYIDAMKAAGLIPQDYDAGGAGGAKYGTALAQMIQHQQEFQARDEHRRAMEARIGGRGRGGGGGDESTQVEAPEDYYGLSVAPGAPSKQTTRVINGIVHVHDTHGGWKPGPKWMQQGAGQDGTAKPTDLAKAVKERMGLQDQFDMLEADRKKQEAADITAGAKDPNYPQKVPFKQSDLYNLTRNRLKQLEQVPGMPLTTPAETPGPVASDKAGGHADTYGVPPVGTIRNGYRFKGGDPKDEASWEIAYE